MEEKAGLPMNHPQHRRSRPILPLVFFLILGSVSVLLHVEKARRQKRVQAVNEQFSALVRARPIEEAKAERARFYGIQYYLGYPLAVSYAVSDFILRLSAITPSGLLHDLQVDPRVRDFGFALTVGIAAGGREAARQAFASIYDRMQDFPEITRISFSESDPAAAAAGGRQVYCFAVSGQVEWQ
jgi:hypothetical protein